MRERSIRLSILSSSIAARARRIAAEGDSLRAMRVMAISDALMHAAGGDNESKKDALEYSKTLRRAEKKIRAKGEDK